MPLQNQTKFWLHSALASLGQVLLYHVGMVAFLWLALTLRIGFVQIPLYYAFFLIPLQVTFARRGSRAFFARAGISIALLILVRIILARALLSNPGAVSIFESSRDIALPFIALELLTVAFLTAGLAFANLGTRRRRLYRLLGATVAAGIAGLLATLAFSRSAAFLAGLERFFQEVLATISGLVSPEADGTLALPPELTDPGLLVRGVWQYALNGFIFGYFVNLSGSWFIGTAIANRAMGSNGYRSLVARFKVPDFLIWPLIASWALVLITQLLKVGFLDALVLNVALVFLFLYGMQGVSIIRYLLVKYNASRAWKLILLLAVVLALVFPALTLAAFVLVPGIGVSEIWLKQRTRRKENDEQ
jgi:hypothetical protein